MLAQGSNWFLGIYLVNLIFGWTVIGWLFCIVAAFITPSPDLVTYLLMGGPMVVIYEFCIWLARWVEPKTV